MQIPKTANPSVIVKARRFVKNTFANISVLAGALALAACGGGGGGVANAPTSTATTNTLVPTDGKYIATSFAGTVVDPALSVDILGMGIVAPNDVGVGVVYGNYRRSGQIKLGLLWLDRIGGSITVIDESASLCSTLGANDSGGFLCSVMSLDALVPSTTYKLVTRLPNGLPSVTILAVPAGRIVSGLLSNGNILSLGTAASIAPVASPGMPSPTGTPGTPTIEYDASFNVVRTLSATGAWSGFGKDGLLYGTEATTGVQTVRFADGTMLSLPCNPVVTTAGGLPTMPGTTSLIQPVSGRNCNLLAASSTGIVVGRFHKSDGSQGIYRFTKTGFEEIPLAADFFSNSGTLNSQSILGVANDGSILVSPKYTGNACIAGPFLIEGAVVVDLRLYLPTQSCFNINASISGGGSVFVFSQNQGVTAVVAKKK